MELSWKVRWSETFSRNIAFWIVISHESLDSLGACRRQHSEKGIIWKQGCLSGLSKSMDMTKDRGNYRAQGCLPLIGIIGGGQLARMQAQAASRLGCRISTIEKVLDCPAADVVHTHQVGDWNDPAVLIPWAEGCDLVALENEFVESATLHALEQAGHTVVPTAKTMTIVQDKWNQKEQLRKDGLPVTSFQAVATIKDIHHAGTQVGWPLVLKKRKQGYDGKGNATIQNPEGVQNAWECLGSGTFPLYVEAFCPFNKELAVMVVRSVDGSHAEYPVVETMQKDHICHVVTAPASISPELRDKASGIARGAVEAVKGLGCFGVEMFLTEDDDILINELAPRVHNSGHYTIEACRCSQFENHIRAILGWPLGDTSLVKPSAVMVNLLGKNDGPSLPSGITEALQDPDAHLHIYGKPQSRKGRKMGHLTLTGEAQDKTLARAQQLATSIHFGRKSS
jgi:5-(carboxyamino)imidazole ribonucleotide synthase